jgi:hypothetical protein
MMSALLQRASHHVLMYLTFVSISDSGVVESPAKAPPPKKIKTNKRITGNGLSQPKAAQPCDQNPVWTTSTVAPIAQKKKKAQQKNKSQ